MKYLLRYAFVVGLAGNIVSGGCHAGYIQATHHLGITSGLPYTPDAKIAKKGMGMPLRDGYAHGTPGWVDLSSADPEAAKAFYGGLFGWQWEDQEGPGGVFVYSIAHLEGRTVAGLGPAPAEMVKAGFRGAWNTYLMVDTVDAAYQAVLGAGGKALVSPLDVMDAGRMAFVMDDQGACSGLWEARLHKGAQVVNEPGAFTWVELYVPDTDKAAEFYRAALGLVTQPVDFGPGMESMSYSGLKVDERVVGGLMGLPMEGMPPQWHVYFGSADVGETASKAIDLGGDVMTGPFPIPEEDDVPKGRIVIMHDPGGAMFSALELDEWPAA